VTALFCFACGGLKSYLTFVLPNIKYDFHKRHFIARSLLLYLSFTSLFYVYVYVLYELFLSSIMLCACSFFCKHVRLSCVLCNKLTYLLTYLQMTPEAHHGNQFHRRCILDRRHTCSAVTWIGPTGTPVAVWSFGATHRRTRGVFVTNSWRLAAFVLF